MLTNLRQLPIMMAAWMLFLLMSSCNGQQAGKNANKNSSTLRTNALVGGPCDACELMYIGMPAVISSTDTSAGWKEKGQPLIITGTVLRLDGKTPAPGIIIYYWQTDNTGHYSPAPGLDARAKRHGHIRGWVKTDQEGQYTIYTIRPAPYPGEDMPAHIHLLVLEPDLPNEYYVDELVFDDDHLLTAEKRAKMENRGGSGILKTEKRDGKEYAKYKMVAGLNIPGYPK